jgi:hypothetical protein
VRNPQTTFVKGENMNTIDERSGNREWEVPTEKDGKMGPSIRVTARDEQHALEQVRTLGHTPNTNFPVKELKTDTRKAA